jgi:hypothetical protein
MNPVLPKALSTLPCVVALIAAIAAPPAALAQGHAHVHGQAQVEVVLEGAELQITLNSPLDSIVGFEHRPRTAAQRQAAEAALRTLADPAALFTLPAAAGCTLQDTTIEAPVLQDTPSGKGHDHPHSHDGEHADLEATWRWRCTAADRLQTMPLQLFERFAKMKRLEVRVAGPAGQGRQMLRRGSAAEVTVRR